MIVFVVYVVFVVLGVYVFGKGLFVIVVKRKLRVIVGVGWCLLFKVDVILFYLYGVDFIGLYLLGYEFFLMVEFVGK